MGRVGVELARVGAGETALVAGELDHRALHAEAQPEERDAVLAGEAGRGDLALDAAEAEPAGDHDAVEVAEAPFGEEALGVVGGDPVDLDLRLARVAAVLERLGHREVGVGEVDVLADQADAHRLGGRLDPRDQLPPVGEVGLVLGEVRACRRRSRRGLRRAAPAGSRRATARRRTTRCPSSGTSQSWEIFSFSRIEIGRSERHTMASGWMPRLRSSVTECCVGLVFCSPDGPMNGTSVTCT